MAEKRKLVWSLALLAPIAIASASACSSNERDESQAHEEENVSRQSQALEGGSLTKQIGAAADTCLKEGTPNKNQGAETSLIVRDSGNHRTLVRFDSAAMSELTDGTTTLSLRISLNASNWGTSGRQVAVYRLTHDWTELGATWNCSVDTNTSNSNADCSGATAWSMDNNHQELWPWATTPVAVTTITNTTTGTLVLDVTSAVGLWRSGSAPNYGLIVKKVDEGAAGHIEFASRETATPPLLIGPCADANGDGVCDPADAGTDSGGGGGSDAASDASDASDSSDGSTCTPASCNDGQPCTVDTCTPSGCTHTPVAAGTSCSDGQACNGLETCDAVGVCQAGVSPTCNSHNPCVVDGCDPIAGCTVTPVTAGTSCSDGSLCNGAETCDGAGMCVAGTPLVCNSHNPCLVDSCNATTGCATAPAAAGTSCADADQCNGTEICDGTGQCRPGAPTVINDNNACTADGCNPLTGPTHISIPNCHPLPVPGPTPFEPRSSIMGRLVTRSGGAVAGATFTVTEAPAPEGSGSVRADVIVSSAADGSFRLRLTGFPDAETDRTPPLHVLLRVDASGVLPVFRDAWVHTGSAVDLGLVKMIPRDAAVTPIGPAGGTANDSANLVQVLIPPGALTSTINVVITPYMARDELAAPLPDNTATMYGFELEPTGTTFASPVTVRMANWRSAPTSLTIPVGFYDAVHGRWEHAAQATWDGNRFTFPATHFTTYDANAGKVSSPAPSPGPAPPPDPPPGLCGPGPTPGPDDGDDDGSVDTGSTCGLIGAGLSQRFALPSYRVKDENFGVALTYASGLAGPRSLGVAPTDYAAVDHSTAVTVQGVRFELASVPRASFLSSAGPAQPGRCFGPVGGTTFGDDPPTALTLTRSFAGSTTTESFSMGLFNNEVDFGGFVHLPMASPSVPAGSGLYRTQMILRSASGGSCLGPGQTFGVSDFAVTGTQTSLEDGPLGTIDAHTLVNHRFTSPYGAGWGIDNVSRVYRDGDLAFLVSGKGVQERFVPRSHAKGFSTATGGQTLARDPHTGEIFTAQDSGSIARVDATSGGLTSVLGGLSFGVPVHGLAVAYVGGSREFIVALQDRLLEIDAGGGQRVLTTRASDPANAQSSVAAREDVVFYTSTLSPILYRVRLSDPARALESMSLGSGGDVRLFPQASLSGVQFGDPRGLAFDADGSLYVADRARNTVYAVRPDGTGNVIASSRVEPAVGDGMGSYLPPAGERQPGVRHSLREPIGLGMTEDGLLFVATTYGLTSFDPIAREAESLTLWGGLDELVFNPTHLRVSLVGITGSSALMRSDQNANLVRIDIDRMSSDREPTRTISKLATGELQLTDTTRAVVERFDTAGRLVERKKRTGETVMTVAYVDASGDAIDRITDAVGGQTVFAYAGGKLQSITDPRGRVGSFSVDANGDLTSLTEPGSETYGFVYDQHHMTQKRSPRSDLTQYTYRPDGSLGTATRPEGALTTVSAALASTPVFNAAGKVEHHGSYTDARGVAHDVVINLKGTVDRNTHVEDGFTRVDTVVYATNLAEVDHVDGFSLFMNFESTKKNRLFVVGQRFQNGVQIGTTHEFDGHGRSLRDTRPAFGTGRTDAHRWLYDADGWLLDDFSGPSNYGDHYERDAAGHVTRIYDFFEGGGGGGTGRERRWTYRADGLPDTAVEHGVTRTFTYDELPAGALNQAGWTDTVGRSMAFGRDAFGNVTSTNDGATTTFAAYDSHNRVTETHDALGNSTTYGYTNAGCGCSQENLVTSVHTPDLPGGVDWQMTYDGDARLATVTDPHAFTESYRYETTGELKRVTDKLLRDTTWSHDQLGRVLDMVDTLGRRHSSTYALPASGAWTGPSLMAGGADATAPSTSLTGALRNGDYQIGHNAYQPAGAPPAISLYRDATFELGYTHYFDSANRLTRRSDRSGLTIDSTTVPPAGPGAFWDDQRAYDTRTSRSILTLQSSTGAAVEASNFDSSFEFDLSTDSGFGRGSGDPLLQETFTRDAAGRPTTLQRRIDYGLGVLFVNSTYTYRPDGRVAQIVNSDGTHDFTYDARGLMLTQVVSGEGTYSYGYDVMGRNNSLTYPDGHSRTQLYDELGRISSRCYEYSGPTTRCYTAQYDAVGNPTRMTDPDGADRFEYDALDRLKKVTREVGGVDVAVEDYDYNALGALQLNAGVALDHQRPRLDGGGNADAALPATLDGMPVTLDAGGRITSLKGTTFTWSPMGFVRQAQDPIPAVAETYGVDSMMRRFAKIQAGTNELYIFEGLDRVATMDASGSVLAGYLFDGIDHPLRITIPATSTTAYCEVDLVGNVRGLRASGGASLGGYRYSAFGQTLDDTSLISQPLRWKGRWFSPVAGGTYDVRARQWSPLLGSFLTIDDLRYFDPRGTLWSWPVANPVRFTDCSGGGCKEECRAKWSEAFTECARACKGRQCDKCSGIADDVETACLKGCDAGAPAPPPTPPTPPPPTPPPPPAPPSDPKCPGKDCPVSSCGAQ